MDRDRPSLTFRTLIHEHCQHRPSASALLAPGRPGLAFQSLLGQLEATASGLRALGVSPSDRVILALPQGPELPVACVAAASVAAAVPVNPSGPRTEFERLFEEVRPTVVLIARDADTRARDAAASLGVTVAEISSDAHGPAGMFHFEAMDAGVRDGLDWTSSEAPALFLRTSGTTSRSKIVPLGQRHVLAAARNSAAAFGLSPDDRLLSIMPLTHGHGLVAGVIASWVAGATVVCPPRFTTEAFFTWLDDFAPTWYSAVPTLHQAILMEAQRHPESLRRHSLRFIRSASAFLPDGVRAELEAVFGVPVVEGYGLSEALQLTNTPLSLGGAKPGSLGRTGSSEVAIMGPAGELLGTGEEGEIVARGPVVMPGYYGGSADDEAVFRRGWLRTGDLGYLDEDGDLFMTGRLKDVVNRGGEKVSPQEVDAVLMGHPSVLQAVAFPVPHPTLGEDIHAAVVLRPDRGETPSVLLDYLRSVLPDYKVPSSVHIVESIPSNATGKLLRRDLAERLGLVGLEAEYLPPLTQGESVVAAIFEELLGHRPIGRSGDFFRLGGHSLLAARAIARIRDTFNVELPLRVLLEQGTVARVAEAIENAEPALPGPTPREVGPGPHPLSFAQQRLWLLHRLEPTSTAYNMTELFELEGVLDLSAFRQSVEGLVSLHPALQTAFPEVDGSPVQALASVPPSLNFLDLSGEGDGGQARAREVVQEMMHSPYDLEAGPLFRISLLSLSSCRYLLIIGMHHIISDGWSLGLLRRDIAELYAHQLGKAEPPETPALSLVDYSRWQHEHLTESFLEPQLGYWRETLRDAPHSLALPADLERENTVPTSALSHRFALGATTMRQLEGLARREGATLHQILLACLQLLLARWCRQGDVVVGSAVSGRITSQMERLVGFFVNTLPIRTRVDPEMPFSELLTRVREATLGAYRNQDVPFDRIIEALALPRTQGMAPLVQVMFLMDQDPRHPLSLEGVETVRAESIRSSPRFDLTLSITPSEAGFVAEFISRPDIFEPRTLERLAERFETLLSSVVQAPEALVGDLEILPPAERHALLALATGPRLELPEDLCFQDLFQQSVERSPDTPALVFEGRSMTYRELEATSRQLAQRLVEVGAGPDLVVGLFMDRSAEAIIGLLGILRAGSAYLPLDPALPPQRFQRLLDDSGAIAVVSRCGLEEKLPPITLPLVLADRPEGDPRGEGSPPAGRVAPSSPRDLAYVLYTSGTTGTPKGVAIEHRQLVNYVISIGHRMALDDVRTFASVSSLSADLGNTMIFPSLALGGTLHIISDDRLFDGQALATYFCEHSIDALKITPSHLAALQTISEPGRLLPRKVLVLGGEASSLAWVDRLREMAPDCRIFNHYGPTETTIGCLVHGALGGESTVSGTLPLGRPLANTWVRVVDERGRQVPLGTPGELMIGGAGVARGYLNQPERTRESFVPDPDCGGLAYRSGDLVRYLPSGDLEFLGRIDDQVKIRGYRVELAEVEATLSRHPAVARCVITAPRRNSGAGDGGDRMLVAYVVGATVDDDVLRQFLRQSLPEFMVPSAFIRMEALPLNANGKIDRRALPEPAPIERAQRVAPTNEVERRLVGAWERILGVRGIGIDDNFFDLGGHSLLAVRLFNWIGEFLPPEEDHADEHRPSTRLSPSTLWEAPTVRQLAVKLASGAPSPSPHPPLQLIQRGDDRPPFIMLTGDWLGMGFYIRKLARAVSASQPFHAFMPHDSSLPGAPTTVEEMADDFIRTLKASYPNGPYRLGGYSGGGLVALEMARRLTEQGSSVELLFIVDTVLPDPRKGPLRGASTLAARLMRWDRRRADALFLRIQRSLVDLRALAARGTRRPDVTQRPAVAEVSELEAAYERSRDLYVPRAYGGCTHLVVTEDGPLRKRPELLKRWDSICGALFVHSVQGDHFTAITRHAETIGAHLRGALDGLDGGAAPAQGQGEQEPASRPALTSIT